MTLRIFIGYDARQDMGYQVCRQSILDHASVPVDVQPLKLPELRGQGVYYRPTEQRDGRLWDVISSAPMATEFAISRFLVPHLTGFSGWSMFVDGDFMFRDDVARLFSYAKDEYAVMCVHHNYEQHAGTKMDGQKQTAYEFKNFSSLMLFNGNHESTRRLTVANVNTWRGLALHQFAWCSKYEMGQLPSNWNWLNLPAAAVHFTFGMPDLPGYECEPYATEWMQHVARIKASAQEKLDSDL
jgi:hypothetical protein